MAQKAKMNMIGSITLFGGLLLIAAGAFVPSEETMALGLFVVMGASSLLLGLNWPRSRAPMQLSSNLVSLDSWRATHPRRR